MANYKVLAAHKNGASGWSTSVKASNFTQAVDVAFNNILNAGIKVETEDLNVLVTNDMGMKTKFVVSVSVNHFQTIWKVRETQLNISDVESTSKKKGKKLES